MATTNRARRIRRRRTTGISTTRILDAAFELHRTELRWLAPTVAVFYAPALIVSNLISAFAVSPILRQFGRGGWNDAGRLTRFIADLMLAGTPSGLLPGLITWAALAMATVPVTIGIAQKLNQQEVNLVDVLKRSSPSLPAAALASWLGLFVTMCAACATAFAAILLSIPAALAFGELSRWLPAISVVLNLAWIVAAGCVAAWVYTAMFAFLPSMMAMERPRNPIDLGRNERISHEAGRASSTATVAIALLFSVMVQALLLSAINSVADLLGWSGTSLTALRGVAELGTALLVQPYWLVAIALIYIETRRKREGWTMMPADENAPPSPVMPGILGRDLQG